ncbi:MAG: hypothetical protein JNK27_15275 [Chitinophagaceae bacterium]|nr:hypothetical protein [Chitinophagaceae bacterium]
MKKYILITVLSLVAYTGFSQSAFGIVSYTLPEGWYAKQTGDNTELLKKGMESANCKIVFFKPVKIVTDTEPIYTKYREELVRSSRLEITSSSAVQKQYGPGWTSFSGLQNIGTKGSAYRIAFYSISDTKQTIFFAVYSTGEELCANELDVIIQTINLTELSAAQSGDKTKAAKRKIRLLPLKSLKPLVNS